MQSSGEDSSEIEVKPDGSWRVKSDNERRDLRQWHLPDGSLCLPDESEIKRKPEASKPANQESTGLKLGIRKNSHGIWEFNKHGLKNTLSSSDRVSEHLENSGPKVIPMSSSAAVSGRDGEDQSVNQDANGHFDLSVNNGMELDSISLNIDPTFGLATQNSSASAKDTEVIVLSDSDDENGVTAHGVIHSNGVNYAVNPPGIIESYHEEPLLVDVVGGSSCLHHFNPDDEFGMPLWLLPSTTQGASSFQLYGSNGDSTDPLANPHLTTVDCPISNGYMLATDTTNPATFMPDSTVGQSINNLNDSLVDYPLAFGGEDPSLQLFLPTQPSDACGSPNARNHPDMSNGLHGDDWISLRLGDGSGRSHGESGSSNGLNVGQQPQSREGALDTLAETGLFLFITHICTFTCVSLKN